jgi:hypothetical protein
MHVYTYRNEYEPVDRALITNSVMQCMVLHLLWEVVFGDIIVNFNFNLLWRGDGCLFVVMFSLV